MIVPILGNVTYSITMDPTVWIFDDRKIVLEEAFLPNTNEKEAEDDVVKSAQRWENEVYHHQNLKPPINKSISRLEGEKILTESYVIPIKDFLEHAEVKPGSQEATLVTSSGSDITISLEQLEQSYLLFAKDGKPLKDDGPVHLIYHDGSNKDNPIKGINKIIINGD